MAGTRGRKISADRFAMVPRSQVPRSAFDQIHTHKTTFAVDMLVPVYIDEVLPGDSHRVRMTAFARLSTPIVPIMDNLILESFFFFVPNRLVWNNWERFMGEQAEPDDTTEFLVPQTRADATDLGTAQNLLDYFGIRSNFGGIESLDVNVLPFRAYNLIWNEYFRDQDIQAKRPVPKGDGFDNFSPNYQLLRRNKRYDYFTSARPWPQKPVKALDSGMLNPRDIPGQRMRWSGSMNPLHGVGAPVTGLGVAQGTTSVVQNTVKESGGRYRQQDPRSYNTNSQALLIEATGPTTADFPNIRVLVSDLRTADAVQRFTEMQSRSGTRYVEQVFGQFGVQPPDFRLQRPEYLGGGRSFVQIQPVAQTAPSSGGSTVLGDVGGLGTIATQGHGFSGQFTEHGYIIGLVNVRADLTYQSGAARLWWRRSMFDFYWPAFAHLGEQAILRKETWIVGDPEQDDEVFGYQERWSEYRYKVNRISGFFNSFAAQTLDLWHLAQRFTGFPSLNDAFIRSDTPIDRVLAVESPDHHVLFDGVFDIRLVRALPMYSIPGIGRRF